MKFFCLGKVAVIRKRIGLFFKENVCEETTLFLSIVENRVLGDDLGLRGKK